MKKKCRDLEVFAPESVTQTLIFMILLYNFKCIVLHDYLELEGEIPTAKRSYIIFPFLYLTGYSDPSIAAGFEGSRRHPHNIHMIDYMLTCSLFYMSYHKVTIGSNGFGYNFRF